MKKVEKRTKSFYVNDGSSVDTEIITISYKDIVPDSSGSCYDHYRKCSQKAAEIASVELGEQVSTIDICFDGEYPCYKRVVSPLGFTKEEYTKLTGQPVPNQWYDNLIALNDEGKVCSYDQQGNISAMISGHSFCKKGTLITRVKTEVSARISIIGQSEYFRIKNQKK